VAGVWVVGVAANGSLLVLYLAIALAIIVPLAREGQVRENTLGVATAGIFLTCAVSHALWAAPVLAGSDLRRVYDLQTAFWDALTAAVALYYWTQRRQYRSLVQGAKLFEDMRARQRQALEINDGIVQGLAAAKLALELDQQSLSREALESALANARQLVTSLLGEAGQGALVVAGDMRRSHAATV
jgi:signal transduction histidine kinase